MLFRSFIGVVGRSQQDINSNKPMDQQLETETEFFRNHAGYRNIAHRCGTRFLAKTLNQVRRVCFEARGGS